MFQFDPLSMIPNAIKDKLRDEAVDFLFGQAKRLLGDEVAGKIKKLRSDAGFQASFDQGLKRAIDRFQREYEQIDEDLVALIRADTDFFKNEQFQKVLLEAIKHPGNYLEEEREAIAEQFVTLLPERKNRERVNQAVFYLLKCLAEELWALPEIQPIYHMQFQKMNVTALQQQVELQKAQLSAINGLGDDIRGALLQLTEAVAQQKLLPSGKAASLPAHQKVLHNLPNPDFGQFVGREAELAQLSRLLHPDTRHFLVTIDGIGGIGKSTLALESAHRYLQNYDLLPPAERFDAIIWTSAKQTILTAEGILERPQMLRTLGDIFKAIAITLNREDITKASVEEQPILVNAALTQQRTLLIVDNLETVDDDKVISFLHELPSPTKAIITTRHRINIAYPIRLGEMSREETRIYIEQQCRERNTATLSVENLERLYRLSGGIPLAINLTLAQISRGLDIETVFRRLGQAGENDLTTFCFRASIEQIARKPAYWLMLSLAFFNPDASRDALGVVADLSNIERDDGLAELETLSLVNRSNNRFRFLPLTKSFVIAQLSNEKHFHLAAGQRWIKYLKSRGQYNRGLYWWFVLPDDEMIEGPNVIEGIEWAYQYGTSDDVLALTSSVLDYLDQEGLWNEIQYFATKALDLARITKDELYVAHFCDVLAWLNEQQGNYDDALRYAEEALNLFTKNEDLYGQAGLTVTLAGIRRKLGDLDTAMHLCDRARAISDVVNNGDVTAMVDSEFGKLARDLGNWDSAWDYFTRIQEWFQKRTELTPSDESLARGVWGQLAYVAMHLGRVQEAKGLFQKSLDYYEKRGTKGYLATLIYRMALAEEALGESEAAKDHAQQAIDLFTRLGMKPDLAEAKKLLDRLQ